MSDSVRDNNLITMLKTMMVRTLFYKLKGEISLVKRAN